MRNASFQHGQPLTPTRTPTSPTFGLTPFQTPKVQSNFNDPRVTWNTADPYATSPNFLEIQHQFDSFTSDCNKPSTALGQKRSFSGNDLDAEIMSHVHRASPDSGFSLPSVEQPRQLSSSPNPISVKRVCINASNVPCSPNFGLALDTGSPMPSTGSIQTPPPIGNASSQLKAQRSQEARFERQSTSTARLTARRISAPNSESITMNTEELSSQINPPLQLPDIQFPPDAFGPSILGSATAPAYPQHKLFWDLVHTEEVDFDFSANLEDPFNANPQSTLDLFVSSHDQHLLGQNSVLSSFSSFPNDTQNFPPLATSNRGQINSFPKSSLLEDRSTNRKPLASGVDPSLLCSSPNHVTDTLTKSVSSQRVLDEDVLQPYAYQIQEARREKAVGSTVKRKKKQKPTTDSPAVKAALQTLREDDANRPTLRRSNTDSVIIRSANKQHLASSANRSCSNSPGDTTQRKSSHLKLGEVRNDSSVKESRLARTAVAFTIDANGRARTETKTTVVVNHPEVISRRQHGDSLSDTSNSETTSDESAVVISTSQVSSFNFNYTQSEQVRRSKNPSFIRSHSHKSSCASTYTTSTTSTHADSPSGPSDGNFNSGGRSLETQIVQTRPDLARNAADADVLSEGDIVVGSEDSDGTAQFELRKILKKKKRNRPSLNGTQKNDKKQSRHHVGLSYGKSSSSTRSIEVFPSDPPHTRNLVSNSSATPIMELKSTSLPSQRHRSIRCVCGDSKLQGQLITWWVSVQSGL